MSRVANRNIGITARHRDLIKKELYIAIAVSDGDITMAPHL